MAEYNMSPENDQRQISVSNATANNLKNISVAFPKYKVTSVIGPTGSGKSSLVTDTILKEGYRRVVVLSKSLSYSALAPFKESSLKDTKTIITNLPPTFGLDSKHQRSKIETVGSTLGIDLLIGEILAKSTFRRCNLCKADLAIVSKEKIAETVLGYANDSSIKEFSIRAVLSEANKEAESQMEEWASKGFEKAYISGSEQLLLDRENLSQYQGKRISVLLDRFSKGEIKNERLRDSIQIALGNRSETSTVGCEVLLTKENGNPTFYLFTDKGFCSICNNIGLNLTKQLYSLKLSTESSHTFRSEKLFSSTDLSYSREYVFLDPDYEFSFRRIISEEIGLLLVNLPISSPTSPLSPSLSSLTDRLTSLKNLGLSHLSLDRPLTTLSNGEYKRIKLAKLSILPISHSLIICDEPSNGLHHADLSGLISLFSEHKGKKNTILLTEHNPFIIRSADYLIELGPKAGKAGGMVVRSVVRSIVRARDDLKLNGSKDIASNNPLEFKSLITIKGASINNLKVENLTLPKNVIISVTGVSGSGKSSLIIQTLLPALKAKLDGELSLELKEKLKLNEVEIDPEIKRVEATWITARKDYLLSSVASYSKIYDEIRKIYSNTEFARIHGIKDFDFKVTKDGFSEKLLKIRFKGFTILEFLNLTVEEASLILIDYPKLSTVLNQLIKFNLSHLVLGQPTHTLSHGEWQLFNLALKFKLQSKGTTYLLDEPTSGLSELDILKLTKILKNEVVKGNSLIAVEHHPLFILNSDYVIELGPGAGRHGGNIIFTGTPTQLIKEKGSATALMLNEFLRMN